MLFLLCSIVIGIVMGWRRFLPKKVLNYSSKLIMAFLTLLLIVMGLRIGMDREILANFMHYGLQALVFAGMAILFSLVAVFILEKIFARCLEVTSAGSEEVQVGSGSHPYRLTLMILAAFALGMLFGFYLAPDELCDYLPSFTNSILYFTLWAVGIDLGKNTDLWKQFSKYGRFVLICPVGVAIASVLAGMLAGKLFGWSIGEGGAVGAGFGWYSLSGVMIGEIHSASLGTIAFLSNVIREVAAILITPLVAKLPGKLIVVAPGGATTMDTTLPIIVAAGPKGIAVIAFVNGVVLSTLVPFLVPFLLAL